MSIRSKKRRRGYKLYSTAKPSPVKKAVKPTDAKKQTKPSKSK